MDAAGGPAQHAERHVTVEIYARETDAFDLALFRALQKLFQTRDELFLVSFGPFRSRAFDEYQVSHTHLTEQLSAKDLARVRKPLRRATGYSADVEGWIVFDPSRGFDLRCHQAFDHSRTALNRNWFVPAVSTQGDGANRKYELDHGQPRLASFGGQSRHGPKSSGGQSPEALVVH
jgi:hypothetical protein